MHHGSRRFPARSVTAGVSAESAGVCKAPSVICGLRFHGLDFKRCLARLALASSHTQAPTQRGVRDSLSRQPQLPQGTFLRRVGEFSWDRSLPRSHFLGNGFLRFLRKAQMGYTEPLLARVGSLGWTLLA